MSRRIYRCQIKDWDGDEFTEISAFDADGAAELYAEKYWINEPSDPHNFKVIVTVEGRGQFEVTAEAVVNFIVKKIEEAK